MKDSEKIGPKGENYTKFMKEVMGPEVMAILSDDPRARSRKVARSMGEKSSRAWMEEMASRQASLVAFRNEAIDKWFDAFFKANLSGWIYRLAHKRPSLLKWIGFRYYIQNIQHQMDGSLKPFPATHLRVTRWGKMKDKRWGECEAKCGKCAECEQKKAWEVLFVWQANEPKKGRVIHG